MRLVRAYTFILIASTGTGCDPGEPLPSDSAGGEAPMSVGDKYAVRSYLYALGAQDPAVEPNRQFVEQVVRSSDDLKAVLSAVDVIKARDWPDTVLRQEHERILQYVREALASSSTSTSTLGLHVALRLSNEELLHVDEVRQRLETYVANNKKDNYQYPGDEFYVKLAECLLSRGTR